MSPRRIGPFSVQPVGFGCMNLDHGYGPAVSAEQGERVLLGALDAGYDFFDTATLYGGGRNEERVAAVLAPQRIIDGRPETIRRHCENSLRRLKTEVIDLYYLHRWDKKVPIEDSVGALSDMVRKGYVRSIGLSEVGAKTLRRAHAVHPVAAVQTEYSLWTRNPEIAVLKACHDLGVAFVAFSPVARAFLCRDIDVAALAEKDIRRGMPRFQPEPLAANRKLFQAHAAIANEVGCTPAQLAIAWLLHKAPHVVPIPGTTSEQHMRDNFAAAAIRLEADTLQRLETLINQRTVSGARYDAQATSEVDTEEF
jgi:aryl-alcohol dehydrogenase-like predicted oxidoreductase